MTCCAGLEPDQRPAARNGLRCGHRASPMCAGLGRHAGAGQGPDLPPPAEARVSPLAVPVLLEIGREAVYGAALDQASSTRRRRSCCKKRAWPRPSPSQKGAERGMATYHVEGVKSRREFRLGAGDRDLVQPAPFDLLGRHRRAPELDLRDFLRRYLRLSLKEVTGCGRDFFVTRPGPIPRALLARHARKGPV